MMKSTLFVLLCAAIYVSSTGFEYYFGTQSILCLSSNSFRSSRDTSPSRCKYELVHRLIKYRDYMLEWGQKGYSINYNRPASSQCKVTWEDHPAGVSFKTIQWANDFGRMYKYYNRGYAPFTNNCHMFANDLSRFLTRDTGTTICDREYEEALMEAGSRCPTENTNAFRTTYAHFKTLSPGSGHNCGQYARDLMTFINGYCETMNASSIPPVLPSISPDLPPSIPPVSPLSGSQSSVKNGNIEIILSIILTALISI